MAKEKEVKLFSVRTQMNDKDYDDVFNIYLESERGNEKKISLAVCILLGIICLVLMIVLKNITFLFYCIGCLIVGIANFLVPVNRKFIAQNKLQFGEKREISFFPHQLSTFEILEDEEELSEEEREEATTVFSTGTMTAYENERGFLFADGKISNQFLYISKRQLSEEKIEKVRDYAKERCSGGYHLLVMKSMLEDDTDEKMDETDETSFVSSVCNQYYGADKLRICDADGHRIHPEDEPFAEEDADEQQAEHTKFADVPEMDVDAEWQKIISEDEE